MIRAEELMLGDVVTVNRSECVADGGQYMTWKQDGKIILIEKDYIRVQYEVDEGDDWDDWEEVDMKDIEPIPITPEILEMNRFESVKNIFGLKTYKLNDDFILEDRGEEKCLCRSCYKIQPSSTFWVCNIEHVHELQHALKLIGITKIIEL